MGTMLFSGAYGQHDHIHLLPQFVHFLPTQLFPQDRLAQRDQQNNHHDTDINYQEKKCERYTLPRRNFLGGSNYRSPSANCSHTSPESINDMFETDLQKDENEPKMLP